MLFTESSSPFFEVNRELPGFFHFDKAAAAPHGHKPGSVRIQGPVDPLGIVPVFSQAIEADRGEAITSGVRYLVNAGAEINRRHDSDRKG